MANGGKPDSAWKQGPTLQNAPDRVKVARKSDASGGVTLRENTALPPAPGRIRSYPRPPRPPRPAEGRWRAPCRPCRGGVGRRGLPAAARKGPFHSAPHGGVAP